MSLYKDTSKRGRAATKRPITNEQYRYIIDQYLNGRLTRDIAHDLGRSQSAIEVIIKSKVPGEYQEWENGSPLRTSPVVRLAKHKSTLDPHREPTSRDKVYFKLLREKNVLNEIQIGVVLNLPEKQVKKLMREYIP